MHPSPSSKSTILLIEQVHFMMALLNYEIFPIRTYTEMVSPFFDVDRRKYDMIKLNPVQFLIFKKISISGHIHLKFRKIVPRGTDSDVHKEILMRSMRIVRC